MTDDDRKSDPTVKQLLERGNKPLEEVVDAETAAELARWFGLPSFVQVAEEQAKHEEPPPPDPMTEERARVLDAISPSLFAAVQSRNTPPEIKFVATLEPFVVTIATVATSDVGRRILAADATEREVYDFHDELRECTPQALLRDLHRSEEDFEKRLEVIDYAAEQRLDAVKVVAETMATSWQIADLGPSQAVQRKQVVDEMRTTRKTPWDVLFASGNLPNRRTAP
jgi:hypothetical protein